MEGTGEERRREAVNPTHGMFMFNICTHQTAGIYPCRYRILCHSRSRKPSLKHVFKDFQLRKTVMEFYERKHRQEPAPSLSCWEWVKFTTRMGEGRVNLQEVDKFYTGNPSGCETPTQQRLSGRWDAASIPEERRRRRHFCSGSASLHLCSFLPSSNTYSNHAHYIMPRHRSATALEAPQGCAEGFCIPENLVSAHQTQAH